MNTPKDNPLALARRRLEDAVHALADPLPIWHAGVCRWADPLYVRLRDALQPRNQPGHRRVPGSRAPCNTAALVLIVDVDMTVAEWQPEGEGAIDRLRRLRDKQWRPEDIELLEGYHRQIQQWTMKAVELLGDKPAEVAIRLPCPSCGRRFVYRMNSSGDRVRVWVLRVSEDGARCLGCQATWSTDQFDFLARLLGCKPISA